ncbi:MAG: ADP-ribose pyrophosphatase [Actinomycetota bacterium]|nr:ADP-ribose pyrophosphatase [Actinomycetota bacterium]
MPPFRKLTEREIFRGHLITVASARFGAPDGDEFDRDIVHHPGAVSVVPVVDGTHAVMVRQYRAAIEGELLEIPAGKRDVEGEAPERTAHRELVEEIGMRAGRMEKLAEFYNSPGFTDEHSFVFLGLDLEEVGQPDPQGPEEQVMTIERVALADVPDLVARGELVDGKSIIGLLLARERLGVR